MLPWDVMEKEVRQKQLNLQVVYIHCVRVIQPRIPEPQISQLRLRYFQGILFNVSQVILIHHLFFHSS